MLGGYPAARGIILQTDNNFWCCSFLPKGSRSVGHVVRSCILPWSLPVFCLYFLLPLDKQPSQLHSRCWWSAGDGLRDSTDGWTDPSASQAGQAMSVIHSVSDGRDTTAKDPVTWACFLFFLSFFFLFLRQCFTIFPGSPRTYYVSQAGVRDLVTSAWNAGIKGVRHHT